MALIIFQGRCVNFGDENITSHLAGTVLNQGECGTDMFPLRIDESSEQPLALGIYTLNWSRVNSSEVTSSSVTMPTVMYVDRFDSYRSFIDKLVLTSGFNNRTS